MENWKNINWDECPECGSSVKVLSRHEKENWVYEGEKAKCSSCDMVGITNCDEELAYITWDW